MWRHGSQEPLHQSRKAPLRGNCHNVCHNVLFIRLKAQANWHANHTIEQAIILNRNTFACGQDAILPAAQNDLRIIRYYTFIYVYRYYHIL